MASKHGQYLVVEGYQLKGKMPSNGIGYYKEFDPHTTYVINLNNKKIVGQYAQHDLAVACAIGLDKGDQQKLAAEIEKVLSGE